MSGNQGPASTAITRAAGSAAEASTGKLNESGRMVARYSARAGAVMKTTSVGAESAATSARRSARAASIGGVAADAVVALTPARTPAGAAAETAALEKKAASSADAMRRPINCRSVALTLTP